MEATILTDGRKVQADECRDVEAALFGSNNLAVLQYLSPIAWLECQCCQGSGEHAWSPSDHGVDPEGGHYGCGPCAGSGEFKVEMP